jgi:hypothetical protein
MSLIQVKAEIRPFFGKRFIFYYLSLVDPQTKHHASPQPIGLARRPTSIYNTASAGYNMSEAETWAVLSEMAAQSF